MLPRADAAAAPQNCPDRRCPYRSLHHRHELNPNGSYRVEIPGVVSAPTARKKRAA